MATSKEQLLEIYRAVYDLTKDVTLGCLEIGCGELCEDSDHIEGLVPHPMYEPRWTREDEAREVGVIDGMYWFFPYEHELIEQLTGTSCGWEVIDVAGLPTARTPESDPSEDRCSRYDHFSGLCPIFRSRPISCRSYPLRGILNPRTGRLEMYVEMICPHSKMLRLDYYKLYVEIYAKLARHLPLDWWHLIYSTSASSSRILIADYSLDEAEQINSVPAVEHPLQYPNWKQALTELRARNEARKFVQIRRASKGEVIRSIMHDHI